MGDYEDKISELENAGWPDIPDWAKDYPFVYMWEAHSMRSEVWFIRSQVNTARADDAPKNATFKTGNTWHTIDECRNPRPFKDMGLPVPERLWYELNFRIHHFFDNSGDMAAMEAKLREFVMQLGLEEPLDFHVTNSSHS